ncbi:MULTISPECIES: V-type ATP synthase subunit E [Haloarcula]|uniref:V-type ATP synthase subunit E n=1 Tax=Haloarcula TaxID=2237 RepID=UPI0023EB8225|nr:V-type ATP synthase subunit E [Halomicroarcula sp. XH51]
MSLETVVEDIRDEARARADEIRDEADERAQEITDEARADAEQIREDREAEVESDISQEREQRLSSAKLQAKQARLGARRDVLEDVRADVEAALADLGADRREELTRALLDAAVAEFDDGADLAVYGRADDQDLLEDVLTDYDGATFAGERDCLGGVVVESEASRVRVNNTFDSLLETVWEDNLRDISDRLFDPQ